MKAPNYSIQIQNSVLFLLIIITLSACNDAYTPKPRGYQRIDFPAKNYHKQLVEGCHYELEIPEYAYLHRDPYPTAEECWYNIIFPTFNATLHLSYLDIKDRKQLFKLIGDSRELVFKHVIKADEIIENYISTPAGKGIFYELEGNTATNAQFYITDSTSHFLRGSLYFNVRTNLDSITPSLNYLKKDMLNMVQTLRWK